MAGDWVQMECDLPEKSEVFLMSKMIGVSRYEIVGRLLVFWSWCDKHSVDGRVDAVDVNDVDDVVRLPGFASALIEAKWLSVVDGGIAIPKHERHFGKSAKSRILKSERQARWRKNRRDGTVDATPSTQATTREEKSINNPIVPKKSRTPSLEEWTKLAIEKGMTTQKANSTWAYYESINWMRGKTPITRWQQCITTCLRDTRTNGSSVSLEEAKALAT